jgi:hypothetical protein
MRFLSSRRASCLRQADLLASSVHTKALQVCTECIMSKLNIGWMTLLNLLLSVGGNVNNVMFSMRAPASFEHKYKARLTDREVIYKCLITRQNNFSLLIGNMYVIRRSWRNRGSRSQNLHSHTHCFSHLLLCTQNISMYMLFHLKNSMFLDKILSFPVKFNRSYRGIYCVHLQGWRVRQTRNQY